MKVLSLAIVLIIFPASVLAQESKRQTALSAKYDLIVDQSNCLSDWRGRTCDETLKFLRKNSRRPFQSISLRAGDEPPIFGDFNFDGNEDVAICDGMNGGYVTRSYRVYLFSATKGRFLFDPAFTSLSQGPSMGFFEIDRKKKTLTTATKMGFGHFTQPKYDVYHGKPRLIYKRIHDESSAEQIWALITTKRLINGKWRTWSKRERINPLPLVSNN